MSNIPPHFKKGGMNDVEFTGLCCWMEWSWCCVPLPTEPEETRSGRRTNRMNRAQPNTTYKSGGRVRGRGARSGPKHLRRK